MDQETAFRLSAILAESPHGAGGGDGVTHNVRYIPSYGYTVEVREGEMTAALRGQIHADLNLGRHPVHGHSYR